jgi:hypothetical protein
MEKVLEQIEVPAELPVAPPEPSGGFPWTGVGLGVLVIVVVTGLYKNYCRKS